MSTGTQNYIPMIGVDKLHYAKVTADATAGYTADTPILIPGTTEAGFNANAQSAIFYADNGPYDAGTSVGDIDVAIACADVPPALRATLFGANYDTSTGELTEGDIEAPYIALQYRIKKSNGAYRYVTIYKAKAIPNNENAQTKGGSINFQTNGFSLKGVKRIFDGMYRRILDDDDPNLPTGVTPAVIEEGWFTDIDWTIAAPATPTPGGSE